MSTEMATNAAIRFPMRDMSNSFMPVPLLQKQTLWKTRHAPFRNCCGEQARCLQAANHAKSSGSG